jgi:hypothetical protein
MTKDAEPREFQIGDLVRKIGLEEVGEVVNVEDGCLYVRYSGRRTSFTIYPFDLVERVPPTET